MTAYNPDPWTVYGMQDGTLTIQDGDGRLATLPELLRLLRVLVDERQ